MEIKDVTPKILYGSLFTYNGNPYRLEEQEEIEEVQKLFDEDVCDLIEVFPEDEDEFENVCAKLDLFPENYPQRVYIIDFRYNEECAYIAFADDWEPK